MRHSELVEIIARTNGKEPKNNDIAKIIGITPSGIRSRVSRDKEYSMEELDKLGEYYKVNLMKEYLIDCGSVGHKEFVENVIKDNHCIKITYRPNVYLSAGYGVEVYDEEAESILLDERLLCSDRGIKLNPRDCEIVTISGNSMSPEYRHGDRVIIDKSITNFIDGHIFAFRYNGECYVKEICLMGSKVKAIPLNKEYEPFFIEESDVMVLGRILPRVRL